VRRSGSACLISLSVRFSLFSPFVPVQIRVDVYSSVQRLYCQNYCHVARRSRRIKSAYQSVSSPDSTVTLPLPSAICSEGGVQAKNAFLQANLCLVSCSPSPINRPGKGFPSLIQLCVPVLLIESLARRPQHSCGGGSASCPHPGGVGSIWPRARMLCATSTLFASPFCSCPIQEGVFVGTPKPCSMASHPVEAGVI
jgi:hypothetical protein